jgi:branched-chain amino acid transport system permease protein
MMITRATIFPIVTGILLLVMLPFIFQSPYHIQILTQLLIWAILFTGLDIAVGHAGLVSVAHGALFGLGAYVTGILTVDVGWGFWSTLPIAILVGALIGLGIGLLTLRMEGHYFVIATLGIGLLITIVIRNWTELTHGELGLSPIPKPISFDIIPLNPSLTMYYLMAIVSFVCVAGSYLLMRTSTGRRLRAIRDNAALAAAVGIDVSRTRLVAFLISAGMAALAGSFQASYLSYIEPSIASYEIGFTALMAIIIGGRATVAGPFLGAAVFVVLPEILRSADEFRLITLGLILILVILFAPDGLAGRSKVAFRKMANLFSGKTSNSNKNPSNVLLDQKDAP